MLVHAAATAVEAGAAKPNENVEVTFEAGAEVVAAVTVGSAH